MKPQQTQLNVGLGLLMLLAGLSFLGWHLGSTPIHPRLDTQALLHSIDMKMTGVELHQYNEQGNLEKHLLARQVTHMPHEDTYFITAPNLSVQRDKSDAPWNLQATEAQTYHGTEHITFKKNVVLHQPQTQTTEASTLKTETLVYRSKTQEITTENGVNFEQGNRRLEANSIKTILDSKQRPKYAIANATPLNRVHFSAPGTTSGAPMIHAYANTLEYLPEQHLLLLKGHADLAQGKRTFSAPVIQYDLLKHHVISRPVNHGKTHIVFYPDKKTS